MSDQAGVGAGHARDSGARNCGELLDVWDSIRSTSAMRFSVTHAMCQHIEPIDAKKHIKYMARQRCVGANGSSTG